MLVSLPMTLTLHLVRKQANVSGCTLISIFSTFSFARKILSLLNMSHQESQDRQVSFACKMTPTHPHFHPPGPYAPFYPSGSCPSPTLQPPTLDLTFETDSSNQLMFGLCSCCFRLMAWHTTRVQRIVRDTALVQLTANKGQYACFCCSQMRCEQVIVGC